MGSVVLFNEEEELFNEAMGRSELNCNLNLKWRGLLGEKTVRKLQGWVKCGLEGDNLGKE